MRVVNLIQSRKEPYSIGEETGLSQAVRYLRDHQVRSVGVLDAAGKLSDVISLCDIYDNVAVENKCPAWTRVAEIMSRDPLVVDPEYPLQKCRHPIENRGVSHCWSRKNRGVFLA